MSGRDPQLPPKVTLEDLLRLKRCERPPADFWPQFEHELRQKQLSALLHKKAWRQRVPRLLGGFYRLHLPLGATAILALTFFTLHYYEPAEPARAILSDRGGSELAAPDAASAVEAMLPAVHEETRAVSTHAPAAAPAGHAPAAAETPADDGADVVPVVAMLGGSASSRMLTPSARSIATNLAVAEASDPELVGAVLPQARRFETVATRTEVMASIPPPVADGASRRARFAFYQQNPDRAYIPDSNNGVTVRATERISRYLDNSLNESISRLGLRGDSVSIKF